MMRKHIISFATCLLVFMLSTTTTYGQIHKVVRSRTCTVCKKEKSVSDFSGDSKTCKACTQKVAEQQKRERQEAEYKRQQQLKKERLAREQAEKERLAHEQAEKDRLAREQAEKERLAHEQAERERIAFRNKVNSLIKMVYVEGGTFMMGGYFSSLYSGYPEHKVTVSGFSIGETEVKQELWEIVMGSNPSQFKGENFPVHGVKWSECQEFISKINQVTGKNYRLPTEAEWEFAARGGSKSKEYKFIGSNDVNEVSWYKKNSGGTMHDVGMKKPNELGLYDMGGNVSEWCQDWFGKYLSLAQNNPIGPSSGTEHILRGGHIFSEYGDHCTPTRRWASDSRTTCSGLRLVLPQEETDITLAEKENQSLRNSIIQKAIDEMVYVEGGTFMMGKGADSDKEKPAHQVTLSSFSIGKTEVTRELWEAVMESTAPYLYSGGGGMDALCPVSDVSWEECQKFIAKLNALTGKKFRLPTEAEWEYAARGGNKSKGYKYSGSNKYTDVLRDDTDTPYIVASKLPNELGLYDMSGNVSEWCQDWYGDYSAEAQTNPTGPSSGTERVHRGGYVVRNYNWLLKRLTRVFDRHKGLPNDESNLRIGFRLAL